MKYTPVRLIPYLEDTDAMRDVPGILKALAERVEQLLTEASS